MKKQTLKSELTWARPTLVWSLSAPYAFLHVWSVPISLSNRSGSSSSYYSTWKSQDSKSLNKAPPFLDSWIYVILFLAVAWYFSNGRRWDEMSCILEKRNDFFIRPSIIWWCLLAASPGWWMACHHRMYALFVLDFYINVNFPRWLQFSFNWLKKAGFGYALWIMQFKGVYLLDIIVIVHKSISKLVFIIFTMCHFAANSDGHVI